MTADTSPDVVSGVVTEDGMTKGSDAEALDPALPASAPSSPDPVSPGSESGQDKAAPSQISQGLKTVPSSEAFLKNEKAFDVITSDANEGNVEDKNENEETEQPRERQLDGAPATVKDTGVEDITECQENSVSAPTEKSEGADEVDPEPVAVVNSAAAAENVDSEPDKNVTPILETKQSTQSEPNMSIVPYSYPSSESESSEEKKAEHDSENTSDAEPTGEPDAESQPISAPDTKPFAVSSSLDPECSIKSDDALGSELRPNSEPSVSDMEQNIEELKDTEAAGDHSNTTTSDSSKSLPESDIKPEENHEQEKCLTSDSQSEPSNTDQPQTSEISKETAEPESAPASGNVINGNEGAEPDPDKRPEQEPASEHEAAQEAEPTPESDAKSPTETSADENLESKPESELPEAKSEGSEPAAAQDTLVPAADRQARSPTRKKPPPRKKPVMTEERPRIPLNRAQCLLMEAKKKEEEEHRALEEERQRSLSRLRKEAEVESGTQNTMAMRQRQQSFQQLDYALDKPRKLPMNKIRVGTVAGPNIRDVRSKVGSLANSDYKPGGGKIKIETVKVDLSKAGPRVQAKSDYKPGGGSKKILLQKLEWRSQSKVGSLNNAKHRPGGGNIQVETQRLSFRERAASKIGSKDNLHHKPGGGDIKVVSRRIEFANATSKVGSMENVQYKPGGGAIRIFEDTAYIRQMRSISAEGRTRRRSPASKSASSSAGIGAHHTPGRVTPNGRSPSRGRGSPLPSPRSPAAKTKTPPHNGRSPNAVRVSPLPGAKSPGPSRRSLSGKTPIPPIGQPSPPGTQESSVALEGDGKPSAPGETLQVPTDQLPAAEDANSETPR